MPVTFSGPLVVTEGKGGNGGARAGVPGSGQETKGLRAHRMESLGILAEGIAHDLNNTLSPS